MQISRKVKLVLVPALKEREAIVVTQPAQGWNFLLLAAQTSVPFGAVSCRLLGLML